MKIYSMIVSLLAIIFISGFSSDPARTDLFPEIKGWKLVQNERVYVPSDLWDLIDGAADSYLSYHFIDLRLADYTNKKGITIRVELYRHNSFNNSFGIYTNERSPDYQFIDIGSQGYLEEGALNFLCGYYYVKITTQSQGESAQNALVEIAHQVELQLNQPENWPEIYRLFPPEPISYSEQYISENFLGFEFLHSAFTAQYNRDGEDFLVFMINSESQEQAREMVEKYLQFTGQDTPASDGFLTIHDPYNGNIDIILDNNVLAGVVGCENETVRKEYIGLLQGIIQQE